MEITKHFQRFLKNLQENIWNKLEINLLLGQKFKDILISVILFKNTVRFWRRFKKKLARDLFLLQ